MLNREARAAWLSTLPDDVLRGLANAWQLFDWKSEEIGRLRLHLAQIEGVESPLKAQRHE
jgi:hypothetical protein